MDDLGFDQTHDRYGQGVVASPPTPPNECVTSAAVSHSI
jgi:hypothetical protein